MLSPSNDLPFSSAPLLTQSIRRQFYMGNEGSEAGFPQGKSDKSWQVSGAAVAEPTMARPSKACTALVLGERVRSSTMAPRPT